MKVVMMKFSTAPIRMQVRNQVNANELSAKVDFLVFEGGVQMKEANRRTDQWGRVAVLAD